MKIRKEIVGGMMRRESLCVILNIHFLKSKEREVGSERER